MTDYRATINGLRELAAWMEQHEHNLDGLAVGTNNRIYAWARNKEEFALWIRAIGRAEKGPGGTSGDLFKAERYFGNVLFSVLINRDEVCERVKVGERLVKGRPAHVIPASEERTIEATDDTYVDVYEWKCPDSVLRPEE